MKLKYLFTVIAIVAITKNSFAQYQQDALRFSTFTTGSTARIKAVGNAGTAIGGDLSSVGGNPAGIGFFTKSEFSITPEYDGSKVNSSYLGNGMNAAANNLNLNNAAVVIYSRLNTPSGEDKTKGWLSLNFGIGYNRTNDYYENVNYGGKNGVNSITNYYAEDANGQVAPGTASYSQLQSGSLGQWGYNQYLIDSYNINPANPSAGQVFKSNAYAGVSQLSNAIRSGGESELDLTLGSNYSNQLYLGVSLGITSLRYNTNSSFLETGTASVYENPNYADRTYSNTFSQNQVTKGTGVNAKFGAIFKPVTALRLGIVITTPTYYTIDDTYSEGMATKISNGTNVKAGPIDYPFSYNVTTPFKVAGGLAIFMGKVGFITGDIEYQDYSSIRIKGDYGGQQTDNNNIKTLYQAAVNAHVGAELRVISGVFLRGGYGVQGNPQKYNGSAINTTSGGFGFRQGVYYVDATYSHSDGSSVVYPYELSSAGATSPAAALSKSNNNVYVTFGMRF